MARPRVYDAIDLKFLGKQINVISKKSGSAICEIMNINAIFRIFLNASHSVFLKKHETTNKIKTKCFFENCGHTCWECYDLGMYQNSEKCINVRWSWSSIKFFLGLKITWLLGLPVWWVLNNLEKSLTFAKKLINYNRVFLASLKYLVELVIPIA